MSSEPSSTIGPVAREWPVLVFDVGANIGAKAALFAAHGARVVCFEPIPECLDHLHTRFASNAQVIIVPVALGAEQGTLPIMVCSAATTISTFSPAWQQGRFNDHTWDRKLDVPVRTLDSEIEKYGLPDYCKIDVEGFESSVLQGLSRQIPVISFEFCKEFVDDAALCVQRLINLGYKRFNLVYGESATLRHSAWIDASQLLAELVSHPHPLVWGDVFAASVDVISPVVLSLLPAAPSSDHSPWPDANALEVLRWQGLSFPGVPLRLHLGCGEQRFEGYINIDYPSEQHNVMLVRPDMVADIMALSFPAESVDEIRLHHVFEHFNRVIALSLLIRWHSWLKPEGRLVIETPDFEEEARAFLASERPFADRMSNIRSLEGDQTAPWGYHVGHWFGERFEHTLSKLGFTDIRLQRSVSGHQPPLHNLTATATRGPERGLEEQLAAADALLSNSTVDEAEQPTLTVWRQQLRQLFVRDLGAGGTQIYDLSPGAVQSSHKSFNGCESISIPVSLNDSQSHAIDELSARLTMADARAVQAEARVAELQALVELHMKTLNRIGNHFAYRIYVRLRRVWRVIYQLTAGIRAGVQFGNSRLSPQSSPAHVVPVPEQPGVPDGLTTGDALPSDNYASPAPAVPPPPTFLTDFIATLCAAVANPDATPIENIHNFNQSDRDRWVRAKASTVPAGSRVLDIGAGTCLYRRDFAHCRYEAHDFKEYSGYQDGQEGSYGDIDYVSDITAIPVPTATYDVVLCTEVLEHVPEPIAALREMARLLKPGGRLFLTAPLGAGLHQEPHHYYGGYTPHWYRRFCSEFGLKVLEITPNHTFFALLAQECARVSWTMPRHAHLHGPHCEAIGTLFGVLLPTYLFSRDKDCAIDQFTIGYHVEAIKRED